MYIVYYRRITNTYYDKRLINNKKRHKVYYLLFLYIRYKYNNFFNHG